MISQSNDETKAFLASLMPNAGQCPEDPEVLASRKKLALDPEVQASRKRLAVALLDREIERLAEERDELAWYNRFGRVMFVIVHLILALALRMAWLEFDNARTARAKSAPPKGLAAQKKSKGKPEPGDEEETAAPHELKLGLDGIAFKSSLQGTVILAIAFGFYFLYLKFVYPIVIVH